MHWRFSAPPRLYTPHFIRPPFAAGVKGGRWHETRTRPLPPPSPRIVPAPPFTASPPSPPSVTPLRVASSCNLCLGILSWQRGPRGCKAHSASADGEQRGWAGEAAGEGRCGAGQELRSNQTSVQAACVCTGSGGSEQHQGEVLGQNSAHRLPERAPQRPGARQPQSNDGSHLPARVRWGRVDSWTRGRWPADSYTSCQLPG